MRPDENLEYKLKKEIEDKFLFSLSEPLKYTKGILNKKHKKDNISNDKEEQLDISDINIKELFYDSLSNSNEIFYDIEEEELKIFNSYNEELDYIDNIHNILFEIYLKELSKYLKYNYKLKEIDFSEDFKTEKDEQIQELLKSIKSDNLSNISINKKIYIYK